MLTQKRQFNNDTIILNPKLLISEVTRLLTTFINLYLDITTSQPLGAVWLSQLVLN